MKTKTLKQILATTVIASTLLITNAGISNAALQANQNTQYTEEDAHINWIVKFRQMEMAGGAMGLSETLNDDLTASSESNNIDVHMMKSTEYGAIAILSASGYGNSSNDNEITSTTGNKTGIMLNTNYWEYVAGGYDGVIFPDINNIYYDAYTTNISSARIGDALGTSIVTNPGCAGWHSAGSSTWIKSYNNYGDGAYFIRGKQGMFSYNMARSNKWII